MQLQSQLYNPQRSSQPMQYQPQQQPQQRQQPERRYQEEDSYRQQDTNPYSNQGQGRPRGHQTTMQSSSINAEQKKYDDKMKKDEYSQDLERQMQEKKRAKEIEKAKIRADDERVVFISFSYCHLLVVLILKIIIL